MLEIRFWKVLLIGLILGAVLFAALSLWEKLPPSPPNLLLISVDALRADHLGCYGYPRPTSPHIDALAARGVLLERFLTPRGLTYPALSTLLTGLECHHHRSRYNFQVPEDSVTLAHILGEQGYQCRAYLANADEMIRVGFDDASEGFSHIINHTKRDLAITERGVRFLQEQAQARRKSFFLWLHYMSPHRPYKPPEPWERGLDGQSPRSSKYYDERLERYMQARADLSGGTLEAILNYYDGCVAFVDSLVAEVLAALEEQGLDDNTLVVFTADHGEELYEHLHYFLHQLSMYDGTLHIPLILYWKGKLPQGLRVSEPVGLVHLMPTLLELLGLDLEHEVDGESFRPLVQSYTGDRPPREAQAIRNNWLFRPVLLEMVLEEGCAYGVYRHPHKYIFLEEAVGFHTQPAAVPGRPVTTHVYPPLQLFDLVRDPKEKENLVEKRPELQAELHPIVQEKLLSFTDCLEDRFPETDSIEPHVLEALEAMGYVVPGHSKREPPSEPIPTIR